METLKNLFIRNWQRKLVAILAAIIVWFFVNSSIIDTKTIPNVPVRLINLPPDKTVADLLPNGVLTKRINVSLSGTKDVINELEPGDIEVVLDASSADNQNEWIVNITKKNLVSLNPEIDLLKHITAVNHNEFVVHLSRLITAKIPINVLPPVGEAPPGYEYLDLWPQKLLQTVSGPEEEVKQLKAEGLNLTFDLNDISQQDLEHHPASNFHDDEVLFIVPSRWKQVTIPFHNNVSEEINDEQAKKMRIYFLKKQTLKLEKPLPIDVFYPLNTSDTINPGTYRLVEGKFVKMENNLPIFTVPLYVKDVSKLFLKIISDNLQLFLIAAPKNEREFLQWSLEVINPNELEDAYVDHLTDSLSDGGVSHISKGREESFRRRFREYLQKLNLYVDQEEKLNLESVLEDGKIAVISY